MTEGSSSDRPTYTHAEVRELIAESLKVTGKAAATKPTLIGTLGLALRLFVVSTLVGASLAWGRVVYLAITGGM